MAGISAKIEDFARELERKGDELRDLARNLERLADDVKELEKSKSQ